MRGLHRSRRRPASPLLLMPSCGARAPEIALPRHRPRSAPTSTVLGKRDSQHERERGDRPHARDGAALGLGGASTAPRPQAAAAILADRLASGSSAARSPSGSAPQALGPGRARRQRGAAGLDGPAHVVESASASERVAGAHHGEVMLTLAAPVGASTRVEAPQPLQPCGVEAVGQRWPRAISARPGEQGWRRPPTGGGSAKRERGPASTRPALPQRRAARAGTSARRSPRRHGEPLSLPR